MSYDKYRNWPLPGNPNTRQVIVGMRPPSLEETVLKDLCEAEDEIERLEILDSYASYSKRAYRQEFVSSAVALLGRQLGTILDPVFLSHMLEVYTIRRARLVKEE